MKSITAGYLAETLFPEYQGLRDARTPPDSFAYAIAAGPAVARGRRAERRAG